MTQLGTHIAQLTDRTDGAGHGVHRLEGHDLRNGDVHRLQELLQVYGVVVAEYVLRDARVTDPLNHGGVVALVGENMAACGTDKKMEVMLTCAK